MRLTESFFARDPREVAQDLLGRELVRTLRNRTYRGRIIETGAYRGYIEGRKREGLAYAPGLIFLYFGPRGYPTLCIATEREGEPSVVTIRELYPLEGIDTLVNGPAKLVRALRIGRSFDGKSINDDNLCIVGRMENITYVELFPRQEKIANNCLGYYRLEM